MWCGLKLICFHGGLEFFSRWHVLSLDRQSVPICNGLRPETMKVCLGSTLQWCESVVVVSSWTDCFCDIALGLGWYVYCETDCFCDIGWYVYCVSSNIWAFSWIRSPVDGFNWSLNPLKHALSSFCQATVALLDEIKPVLFQCVERCQLKLHFISSSYIRCRTVAASGRASKAQTAR